MIVGCDHNVARIFQRFVLPEIMGEVVDVMSMHVNGIIEAWRRIDIGKPVNLQVFVHPVL